MGVECRHPALVIARRPWVYAKRDLPFVDGEAWRASNPMINGAIWRNERFWRIQLPTGS